MILIAFYLVCCADNRNIMVQICSSSKAIQPPDLLNAVCISSVFSAVSRIAHTSTPSSPIMLRPPLLCHALCQGGLVALLPFETLALDEICIVDLPPGRPD